jgi:hypothetical protein
MAQEKPQPQPPQPTDAVLGGTNTKPRPSQPTDAVLGGTNTKPRPYDAVLGKITKRRLTLEEAVRRIDQAAKDKLTELDLSGIGLKELPSAIGKCMHLIPFPQNYATIIREFKDDYMKVNYPERIDATARELKIILSQQRTITNRQKIQTLYWLKSGFSQSVTDVAERLGVHRAC